jgi:hypothetical protein
MMRFSTVWCIAALAGALAGCSGSGAGNPSSDGGAGGDSGPAGSSGGSGGSFAEAGSGGGSGASSGSGAGSGSGSSSGGTSADGGDAAAPGAPHGIMIITMENHGYHDIIGDTTDAPFTNSLATSYASATAWTDVSHPSLPNYLALTSGSIFSDPQDCVPTWATSTGGNCTFDSTGKSLADQLTAASISWKAYMEDMPSPCDTGDTFSPGNYDVNHNPFVYYDNVAHNPVKCDHVVPYTQLATDLAAGTLPTYIWVSPNVIDDTHDGTIAQGDTFLKGLITSIQGSAWYEQGGSIILTYDEGETEEQIVNIVVSKADAGHGAFTPAGNHYGTLRGIEEAFGLPLLGSAGDPSSGDLKPLL